MELQLELDELLYQRKLHIKSKIDKGIFSNDEKNNNWLNELNKINIAILSIESKIYDK